MAPASERLVLALDGLDPAASIGLLDRLHGVVETCKIGPALFHAGGAALLRRIGERGFRIFLDLKFHDIPRTVAETVRTVCLPPVRHFTLHALGGAAMLRSAVESARQASPADPPLALAVTILTSLGPRDLAEIGLGGSPEAAAVRLARIARGCGAAGVVCSGAEAGPIRSACGPDFQIWTPGIRPRSAPAGDQVRVATAAGAIRAGADRVIVGRPIREAPDPRQAAGRILEEIRSALEETGSP